MSTDQEILSQLQRAIAHLRHRLTQVTGEQALAPETLAELLQEFAHDGSDRDEAIVNSLSVALDRLYAADELARELLRFVTPERRSKIAILALLRMMYRLSPHDDEVIFSTRKDELVSRATQKQLGVAAEVLQVLQGLPIDQQGRILGLIKWHAEGTGAEGCWPTRNWATELNACLRALLLLDRRLSNPDPGEKDLVAQVAEDLLILACRHSRQPTSPTASTPSQ